MAIGRVSGSMLVSNLDRQGTDLQFTTNNQPLVYMDFAQFKFGVNTNVLTETFTIHGNLSTTNVLINGTTISAKNSGTLLIGSQINLGDITNVKVTGGSPNYIVYTDGAGNLNFGNLNSLSGLEGFTGNHITLGSNSVGSLSSALNIPTSTSVTDGIALVNQLLGNITDSTGSNIHVATAFISGNLSVLGNIYGNAATIVTVSGAFHGDPTTGFGALYAGIPSGYSIVPNEVAQFSGNANSYVQINAQNINSGTQATTDWIATAPQGTDTTYYVDVGIAGLTYDNTSPNNSLGTSLYGGDAYVYTQGNTSTVAGGNLVVGTTTPNKVIRFISGGINSANVVATMMSNAVVINATTQSTSTTTGALQVAGGVGIVGNVQANSYITTNGVFWSNGARALYGNVDVDAYLPIYTGNIASGNVTTSGNVYTNYISATTGNVVTFTSTGAVKLPIGNSSNRPTGAIGEIRYNTDTSQVEFYNGLGWIGVTSTVTDQTINGDGVNATYTLDQTSTTVGILVSINGTIQQPTVSYTVSGNQITFSEIPLSSDVIDIRFLGGLATLNNTLTDDLTISGNLTVNGTVSYSGFSFGNVLPSANVTYSLGSSTRQWKELWLSNNTLYLGNIAVTASGGNLLIGGTQVTQTFGNANVASYLVANPQSGTYSNSNVASYLVSYSGNISAGNISATTSIRVNGKQAVNGPTFSAIMLSGQVIASGGFANVVYDGKFYDTNTCYNTANGTFKPNVEGYYQFNWTAGANAYATSSGIVTSSLYKNNTVEVARGARLIANTGGVVSSGSTSIYMNGTTDYVQIKFLHQSGSNATLEGDAGAIINGGSYANYFNGFMARGA